MSKRTAQIELRPTDMGCSASATGRVACHLHGSLGVPCPSLTPPSKRPHYLRLVAANGEILAHSENYASRRNARRAVSAWREAFFQVGGGDDPDCRPVPVVEFTANGSVR